MFKKTTLSGGFSLSTQGPKPGLDH